MNRVLSYSLLATLAFAAACSDGGQGGGADASPDLALPAEVKHLGPTQPVCCLETNGPRVLYLVDPLPGNIDPRTMDVITTGELHLSDAYGADIKIAQNVPAGGYMFTPIGDRVLWLQTSGGGDAGAGDGTDALMSAALAEKTIGSFVPETYIPRGMLDDSFADQAFFSPSSRYMITGISPPNIQSSSDLTVLEVETGRIIYTLPHGSFDYIENVTSSDLMVFENSTGSQTAGVASLEGLYVLPLSAAGGTPALIDTRTTQFEITADQQKIIYLKYDGSMWLFDLSTQAHVQLQSNVVSFTLGPNANGPLVWIGTDLGIHIANILQPISRSTPPGSISVQSTFFFTPNQQDLYYFANASTQDSAGDLYRLSLLPGATSPGSLIALRVSFNDFTFQSGGARFLRNLDGTGQFGELVSSDIDGGNQALIAQGVPTGSILSANPAPLVPVPPKGNPVRGPIDMMPPVIAPVYALMVNGLRDQRIKGELFDNSPPVLGQLAFARGNGQPVQVDPTVHVGGYAFSDDGYVLAYIGGVDLNLDLDAYTGSLHIYQTLVDQHPVEPMLDGVSEMGPIQDRGFFVAAPAAKPPGLYFVHY
jgi:hypothetical protein